MLYRYCVLFIALFALYAVATAAVTEVTVAQGHTLYGIRHKLYNGTRVAPGHTLSGNVVSAPTTADLPRVQINNLSDVGGGYYSFDIHANSTASEGDYVLRFYDHSTRRTAGGMRTLPRTLTVHVKKVAVVAVSFRNGSSGSLSVWNPGSTDVEYAGASGDYEWINGVQNQPAAYVRNTGPKYVKVKLHGPPGATATISATGGFGGIASKSITFNATTGEYYADDFRINNNPISTTVATNQIGWAWQAVISGVANTLNSTSHKVYTTASASVTSNRPYWQLYEIGCDSGGTLTGIRDTFGTRHIAIPGGQGEYIYYGCVPGGCAGTSCSHSTRSLLREGHGHCDAFSRAYDDILSLQGIQCQVIRVLPVGYDGIIVDPNATAQSNPNPPNEFNLHDIDRPAGLTNILDDPSYGNDGFADLQAWESASLTGFYDIVYDPILGRNVQVNYSNPAGLQTSENPITY